MKTNNTADSFMISLKSLIGANLLVRLEEININLDALQIKTPQKTTPNPFGHSNLRFNNEHLWTIEVTNGCENLSMHFNCGAYRKFFNRKIF